MIRLAAIADIHYGADEPGPLKAHLKEIAEAADVLLIAGDLTRHGEPEEAAALADDLARLDIPKVAVLGNHDYHSDREAEVVEVIAEAGVRVLEGTATMLQLDGLRLGVAGVKGFGGGFAGACVTEFGEPEVKAFARYSSVAAGELGSALEEIRSDVIDVRVALLHYSPVEQTLVGERPQLWPFLGNYLLAEAVDRVGADIVFHGHAHGGSPEGMTPKGVRVLNVAHPVIRKPFELVQLGA